MTADELQHGLNSPQQIRALLRRLISVQEDERRRIARDLHDHLGQQLTALRMNLEVFRLQSGLDEARLTQLERTQQLAEDLDRSIDFLTWQLRPPAIERGLPGALRELVNGWSDRFPAGVEFEIDAADVRLHREIEENLYRIAQEALNNIAKHAGATYVKVAFDCRDQRAILTVEDNGRGFDAAANDNGQSGAAGLGLVGMRERAALLGGKFEIRTAVRRGTSIVVTVPVKPC